MGLFNMVFYKQTMWTGAAGSWTVLQLQGCWQTEQDCSAHHSVLHSLQKMVNIKHQISVIPLLIEVSPWHLEGEHMRGTWGTWQPPKVLLSKMPSSWFHTTSCSSDLASAHSSESLCHTGADGSRIHSVNALGALPSQPLPGGVGRGLRAREWQPAHQNSDGNSFWVERWLYFSSCSS